MFSIGWPSLAPNNNITPLSLFARLASGNLENDHVDRLFELMCVTAFRVYNFLSCVSATGNLTWVSCVEIYMHGSNKLSKILASRYIIFSPVCVKDRFGRMFSIGWPSQAPNNNITPLSLFARLASGNLGNDHVDQLFELQMCVNVLRLYHFLSCGSPARN